MSKGIDGTGIALVGVGSVFLWAGIKGYSTLAIVQNLVTGKPVGTNVNQTTPLTVSDSAANLPGSDAVGVGPSSGTDNVSIGRQLAAGYGWANGSEWDSLYKLWNRESGWNNHAINPESHAYGIAQALPWTKMPKPAWPESDGGQADPRAQISWGLSYIKGRYGTPSAAWAHETSAGWY